MYRPPQTLIVKWWAPYSTQKTIHIQHYDNTKYTEINIDYNFMQITDPYFKIIYSEHGFYINT